MNRRKRDLVSDIYRAPIVTDETRCPYFQVDVEEYQADTADLTIEEAGMYGYLLAIWGAQGFIENDAVATIARPVVRRFFRLDENDHWLPDRDYIIEVEPEVWGTA